MKHEETISPGKCILDAFEPTPRIAILSLRGFRQTVQPITSAEKAAGDSEPGVFTTWNTAIARTTFSISVHIAWPVFVAGFTARRIALRHGSLRARKICFAFSKTSP